MGNRHGGGDPEESSQNGGNAPQSAEPNEYSGRRYNTGRRPHNMTNYIRRAQITGRGFTQVAFLPSDMRKRVDRQFDGMPTLVSQLRLAIDGGVWRTAKKILSEVGNRVCEVNAPRYKNDRDAFVMLRGPDELVRLVAAGGDVAAQNRRMRGESGNGSGNNNGNGRRRRRSGDGGLPPSTAAAAALLGFGSGGRPAPQTDETASSESGGETRPVSIAPDHAYVLSEALAILRELCFSVPNLSQRLCCGDEFLKPIFALMRYNDTFNNAVGLAEEILAMRDHTFDASDVPGIYDMIRKMSCRQLAFFCRLLALMVFEPEDRHMMESSKVLGSIELLQMRRDRMARMCPTINRNHALLVGSEDLLPRLVALLRMQNAVPSVFNMSHYLVAHSPSTADAIYWMENSNDFARNDWDDPTVADALAVQDIWRSMGETDADSAAGSGSVGDDDASDDDMPELEHHNGDLPGIFRLFEGIRLATEGRGEGETNAANSGGMEQFVQLMQDVMLAHAQQAGAGAPPNLGESVRALSAITGLVAHGGHDMSAVVRCLSLAPHQVEVLFVLCTLLGGCRKVDCQDRLASLGLIEVLTVMFDRLNWGSAAPVNPHPVGEGIHGPGCDCNPESALRVQYLRLVHNYCDRDRDNRENKLRLLSPRERDWVNGNESALSEAELSASHTRKDRGLLMKIAGVLMTEPADSMYRFWLASCVESFLPGASHREQLLVAKSGLLNHLLDELLSTVPRCPSSLQTAFDLLGELAKGNQVVLKMVDQQLAAVPEDFAFQNFSPTLVRKSGSRFSKLMDVLVTNLVDSNVFVRSMLLSTERLRREEKGGAAVGGGVSRFTTPTKPSAPSSLRRETVPIPPSDSEVSPTSDAAATTTTYLTHSWCDIERHAETVPGLQALLGERRSRRRDGDVVVERPPVTFANAVAAGAGAVAALVLGGHRDSPSASPVPGVGGSGETDSDTKSDSTVRSDGSTCEVASKEADEDIDTSGAVGGKASGETDSESELSCVQQFLLNNTARLLRDLMKCVTLEEVNHENICCLNTAVVIFVFARRQGRFTALLEELRTNPDLCDDGRSFKVMANFRRLLWFWREYYSHRGRDRISLEFSSHIRFAEWADTVDMLCGDDGSETALLGPGDEPVVHPVSPYSRPPRPVASG